MIAQNNAMLEGILTNMSATLSSQSLRYFDHLICLELAPKMAEIGCEFDKKKRSDQAQTSDDLIMEKRVRITGRAPKLRQIEEVI